MNTERKLIQQLRDALNEYQPCDHANTEIVSAGWHDCKQCGELIRPAHYARDREDTARVVDLIAAADAYLASPDWIRVEDALPVVPDGKRWIMVWVFCEGLHKSPFIERFCAGDTSMVGSHWMYLDTPQPPEGSK
jgi:hypothetical protein